MTVKEYIEEEQENDKINCLWAPIIIYMLVYLMLYLYIRR